jgi:hypothetical protein
MQKRNLYHLCTFKKGAILNSIARSLHSNYNLEDLCSSLPEIEDFLKNNLESVGQKGTATLFLYKVAGTIFFFMAHPLSSVCHISEVCYHTYDLASFEISHVELAHRIISPYYNIEIGAS